MSSNDLVVVLPGIMGSTLANAQGKPIWGASAGAMLRMIGMFGRGLKTYQLPEGIGDEHPGDGVEPTGLMPDLHALPGMWTPVKGYDLLLEKLERLGYRLQAGERDAPPANLLPVPYDWRLSNRHNGQRLACIVEPALERWRAQGKKYATAQVVFVCHSMGGLVARWYVEQCSGAEITRKLVTLGTPYRGAAKALVQLVNGVHKGIGRLSVDLTDFVRSMPSTYQLLPEYACVEEGATLRKTTEVSLPDLDTKRVADALRFHTDLHECEAARPASRDTTHAIVGTRQPTTTSVRITQGRAEALDTIDGDNDYGDATVPLAGAIGHRLPMDTNLVRRVADQHSNLHRNQAALDEIEGVLTARPVRRKAARAGILRRKVAGQVSVRVTAPDLVLAGQDLAVTAEIEDTLSHGLTITVTDEHGALVASREPRVAGGRAQARFADLAPGAYTVDVTGTGPGSPVLPVSTVALVWGTPG